MAIVDCVVVGWNNHAYGQLLILLDIVFSLVVCPLGIGDLVRAFNSEKFELHPDQGVGDLVDSDAGLTGIINQGLRLVHLYAIR